VEVAARYWTMRDDLPGNARVAVAGQPVTTGRQMIFPLGSAARDEQEFDAPDTFRWDRPIAQRLVGCAGRRHTRFRIGAGKW